VYRVSPAVKKSRAPTTMNMANKENINGFPEPRER
jgi:hypothetical protein